MKAVGYECVAGACRSCVLVSAAALTVPLQGMSDDIPGAGKNAGLLENDRKNQAKSGAIRQSIVLLVTSEDAETRSHCSKILRNLSNEPCASGMLSIR